MQRRQIKRTFQRTSTNFITATNERNKRSGVWRSQLQQTHERAATSTCLRLLLMMQLHCTSLGLLRQHVAPKHDYCPRQIRTFRIPSILQTGHGIVSGLNYIDRGTIVAEHRGTTPRDSRSLRFICNRNLLHLTYVLRTRSHGHHLDHDHDLSALTSTLNVQVRSVRIALICDPQLEDSVIVD